MDTTQNNKDPGFVRDFKSRGNALLAVRLIADLQRGGATYSEIVNYPGFRSLFMDFWANQTENGLIVKLKNIVRDLRDGKRTFSDDWAEAKDFFLSRKWQR